MQNHGMKSSRQKLFRLFPDNLRAAKTPKADALKKLELFQQKQCRAPGIENHLPKALLTFQNIESC
jgi:hypothetical protein